MLAKTMGQMDDVRFEQLDLQQLHKQIYDSALLLPAQGPITAFAFLNPLQGLESLPFDEALRRVKKIYGCEPYLDEGQYRERLSQGRISLEDLNDALDHDLGEDAERIVASLISVKELRSRLLRYPLTCGMDRELDWLLAESDALRFIRPDVSPSVKDSLLLQTKQWIESTLQGAKGNASADPLVARVIAPFSPHRMAHWNHSTWEAVCLNLLWALAVEGVGRVFDASSQWNLPIRHRDLLQRVRMSDCDQLVHEILVRFTAAYLDQGYAHWALPNRDAGYFRAFCDYQNHEGILTRSWAKGLSAELQRIVQSGMSPLESIRESLQLLGVPHEEQQEYLQATLLALRGFSGMVWQTEIRPDRVYISSPPGTLVEYLAVRLILDRFAVQYAARESLGYRGPLSELRDFLRSRIPLEPEITVEQAAYVLFQLAQLSGWSPKLLSSFSDLDWKAITDELVHFSNHERRRVFQSAFERGLLNRSLDAVAARAAQPPIKPAAPRLQVVCCIDAREESFRRHIEELSPEVETFGTAGFFGIAMYYRGAADAHFASLAPIVVFPQHWVTEEVVYSFEDAHRTRAKARRVIGSTSHSLHVGTRGSLGGALVATLLGPLATAPLMSRVLFPRLTGAMHRTARQFVAPPAVTRLHLERSPEHAPSNSDEGLGFTVAEMAERGERALRDIGLTSGFARLVIFMGHGSTCLNNPHESAYHCGACSGSPGGPNARALAAMLNDPRVRRILASRGLPIPDETYFLGALHNTATEEITFYDMELIPAAQIGSLRWARSLFRTVAERNAHERCRRFDSADLSLSPHEALLHVQNRTEDLAQTRPEYGNGTNAVCFVGRRSRIRGLFLDRRSFLMSYDPASDDTSGAILARILSAVIPVCEGINTLYTFSAMDSRGWGSGTKLPHNVTSLLGVMDGSASDLRTGIPWQGVDIHEPVRLLFIIETKPEILTGIMDANPTIARICRNEWSHIAVLDPESNQLQRFIKGKFEPYQVHEAELPQIASSADWYRGARNHLGFARVISS